MAAAVTPTAAVESTAATAGVTAPEAGVSARGITAGLATMVIAAEAA